MTSLLLPLGLVLIVIAILIVVYAVWPTKISGTRTLATPTAHGLKVGDTFQLPGEGLCVALEVPGPHTVVYEPQHVKER